MLTFSVVLSLCAGVAPGAYIQDFDSLSSGPINGQDGWVAGTGDVVQSAVAKSGKALELVGWITVIPHRDNVFDPRTVARNQRIDVDFYFSTVASDLAPSTNLGSEARMYWNGPTPTSRYNFLYNQSTTDSFGTPHDSLALNSQSTTSPLTSQTWYHLRADIDWLLGVQDGIILNADGSTFWDPPAQTMPTTGIFTANGFYSSGDPAHHFFIDNLAITNVPEPATAAITVLVVGGWLRRRR